MKHQSIICKYRFEYFHNQQSYVTLQDTSFTTDPVNHSNGSIRRMTPLQILWKGYSQILVVKDHVGREQ
jgi:hypothetical protein